MATRHAGEVPLPDGTWGPAPKNSAPKMKTPAAVKRKQALKAAIAKAAPPKAGSLLRRRATEAQ